LFNSLPYGVLTTLIVLVIRSMADDHCGGNASLPDATFWSGAPQSRHLLHFAALIRGEVKRPLVTIDDAAGVMALTETHIRSAQHGIPMPVADWPSTNKEYGREEAT
jgi:hypothetical protein